jgi:hypothetical protein
MSAEAGRRADNLAGVFGESDWRPLGGVRITAPVRVLPLLSRRAASPARLLQDPGGEFRTGFGT